MDKSIVVFIENREQCEELCTMLEKQRYTTTPIRSLPELERCLQSISCLIVILDLNNQSVDNRLIRDLTIKNPGVYFLGLTELRFNPELKEAICYHLYACLTKPVDLDELFYWIKCICEEETGENKSV